MRRLHNFKARGETLPAVFVFTLNEAPEVLGLRTREQARQTLLLMRDAGDLIADGGEHLTYKVRLPGESAEKRRIVVRDRSDRLGVQRLGHARRYDARKHRDLSL